MRHKAMQLVLGMLARCRKFSSVLGAVFWVPLPRFGNEIGWCFAVADASQSHAACAWQARWLQGTFLEFLCFVLGTKLGVVFCCCGCLTKPSRPNLRRRRRPSPVESQSSAQDRWRCSSPSTSGWWGGYLDMPRLQESHQDQHMNGVYHRASLLRNEGPHRDFSKRQTEILNRMVAQHSLHQMAQHGPQAVPT